MNSQFYLILLLIALTTCAALAGPPPLREPEVPAISDVAQEPPDAVSPALRPTGNGRSAPKGIRLPKKRTRSRKRGLNDKDVIQDRVREAVQHPVNSMSVESKTIYSYVPDAIYLIYAAINHVVDVQLQAGETIPGRIVAGDTHRWEVGTVIEGTGRSAIVHVLIKPIQAGIETNFLIATDRHSYRLYAQSQDDFFIPTVGWAYPEEEMISAIQIKKEQQRLDGMVAAPAIIAANLNFKYKIKPEGHYSWTPIRAFDDGSKTYIQMSPEMKSGEAPAFFIRVGKQLNLVNYRIRRDYFIVDRLFNEGELRSGKKDSVRVIRETSWFSNDDNYHEPGKMGHR